MDLSRQLVEMAAAILVVGVLARALGDRLRVPSVVLLPAERLLRSREKVTVIADERASGEIARQLSGEEAHAQFLGTLSD